MDVDVIKKIKKLYRIQDAFEKYNIFDIKAFENDECFTYIRRNYKVHSDFEKQFHEKYTHEVTSSQSYKERVQEMKENEKNDDQPDKKDDPNKENGEDKPDSNDEHENDEIEYDYEPPKEKRPSIKEIDKIMFKKIALISHPDKSTNTDNVVVFKKASDFMHKDWSVGLIHCCGLLKVRTDFIYIDDEMSNHFFNQMRSVIEEILQLYYIRNN